MNKAILFLIFNRLETTKEVFEQIKNIKPKKLYIASDGPRKNVEGELEKVKAVRDYVLNNIDWDCQIKTLFRDSNLGCGVAIFRAISWFFENESDGIILEDDCVPCKSFFLFCESLLEKYKDNKNIWQISGNGYYKDVKARESYYFSKIPQCWGWATWADRWEKFRFDVSNFNQKDLKNFSRKKEVQDYWKKILKDLGTGQNDIWDYNWVFTIIENKGYCIDPYNHLVSNIGVNGVHFNGENFLLNVKVEEFDEIIHPKSIKYNNKAIDYIYRYMFGIKKQTLRSKLNKIKKKLLGLMSISTYIQTERKK